MVEMETAEYAVCDATANDGSHNGDRMIAFRTSIWQDVTEGERKFHRQQFQSDESLTNTMVIQMKTDKLVQYHIIQ